jgi:hypothetical protein
MISKTLADSFIARLGRVEERIFTPMYRFIAMPMPALTIFLLLATIVHEVYLYEREIERSAVLKQALVSLRAQLASEPKLSSARQLPRVSGKRVSSLPLDVINEVAEASQIRIDGVQFGVSCHSGESVSEEQIQIVFRSRLYQIREFHKNLTKSALVLVPESLLIARELLPDSTGTAIAKVCVSIVTKTS